MTLEEKIDRLVSDISDIKVVLKGYNGGLGLLKSFEQHCNQDREFRTDYYKFKRWCIGVFCFMVGAGIISVGVVKVLEGGQWLYP